jgi:hypothetical protein
MNIKLQVSFTGEGDAFQDGNHGQETARILRAVAGVVEHGGEGRFDLRDINGNWVGSATFTRGED